jgi:hypothetical protein
MVLFGSRAGGGMQARIPIKTLRCFCVICPTTEGVGQARAIGDKSNGTPILGGVDVRRLR